MTRAETSTKGRPVFRPPVQQGLSCAQAQGLSCMQMQGWARSKMNASELPLFRDGDKRPFQSAPTAACSYLVLASRVTALNRSGSNWTPYIFKA